MTRKGPKKHQLVADLIPADPLVLSLFANLQLAHRVHNALDSEIAGKIEREAWSQLIDYLQTVKPIKH